MAYQDSSNSLSSVNGRGSGSGDGNGGGSVVGLGKMYTGSFQLFLKSLC